MMQGYSNQKYQLTNSSYDEKKSVFLTDKESDIMMALMNNKFEGINKELLLYDVWGFNKNISTHTFETHLYRLRKKIKDNLISGELIINENSIREGYEKFESKRGDEPTNKWYTFYILTHVLKAPILAPMIFILIFLNGGKLVK